MLQFRDNIRLTNLFLYLQFRPSLHHHIPAEFTRQNDERAIQPTTFFEVQDELSHRRIDQFFHVGHAGMPVLVRIKPKKGHVFRGDTDETRTPFCQTLGHQTTQAELTGIIHIIGRLRFPAEVKSLGLRRFQQPVRLLHGSDQRFPLVITAMSAQGTIVHQLLVETVPAFEPLDIHAGRREHTFQADGGIRDHKGSVFAAQESGRMEGLQLLPLTDREPLPNVNESRDHRVHRPLLLCDPCANMRREYRLRRLVAGMPVILMTGVQDMTQICGHIGADQRPAIHHLPDR